MLCLGVGVINSQCTSAHVPLTISGDGPRPSTISHCTTGLKGLTCYVLGSLKYISSVISKCIYTNIINLIELT